jgi:DNA-directed RNA polymerase III subunit RPC1
MISEKDRIKFI